MGSLNQNNTTERAPTLLPKYVPFSKEMYIHDLAKTRRSRIRRNQRKTDKPKVCYRRFYAQNKQMHPPCIERPLEDNNFVYERYTGEPYMNEITFFDKIKEQCENSRLLFSPKTMDPILGQIHRCYYNSACMVETLRALVMSAIRKRKYYNPYLAILLLECDMHDEIGDPGTLEKRGKLWIRCLLEDLELNGNFHALYSDIDVEEYISDVRALAYIGFKIIFNKITFIV